MPRRDTPRSRKSIVTTSPGSSSPGSTDTHEKGDTQTQPIVIGRTLFGYTPTHKTFAVDAATGKQLWQFDSGMTGTGANRGLMYWADGESARILAAVDNFVYALNAATGKPIAAFGNNGRIDLRENLGREPSTQSVRLTSPGVIFKDLMIVGGRVAENLPASPGHVRAYDLRTGALRWSFHTIPQPGEAGYETWPKDAWQYIGGANSWPGMTLDAKRGLVFVPTAVPPRRISTERIASATTCMQTACWRSMPPPENCAGIFSS